MRELIELLGRSESSLRRDLAAGRLPRPIRQGRSVGWMQSDVEAYVQHLRTEANGEVES